MADRILVWFISEPNAPLPAFYLERDYVPTNVRIYAGNAPIAKDFEVDILDDGVTLFADHTADFAEIVTKYTHLGYNTLAVSTYAVGETVSGTTSSAAGTVITDGYGNMTLEVTTAASFADAEIITGGTSGATALVVSSHRDESHTVFTSGAARTTAVLSKGENLNDVADDFKEDIPNLDAGSVITCSVTEMGDASNVTVQLELEAVGQ